MTTPMPAMHHEAGLLAPQPFGLYSAATLIDLPTPTQPADPRLSGGVDWTPSNCGPSGIWPHEFCPPPDEVDPEDEKTGERPADGAFPSVTVWATDECSLYAVDIATQIARAQHLLELHTPLWVEQHTATLLAARAAALPAAASLTAAVGALEQRLGDTGFPGVLHARRGLAAALTELRLVERDGDQLLTPLGNRWAFGGGYNTLGATLYATGPVTIWHTTYEVRDAVDYSINERQAVAERTAAVGWECPEIVYKVTVS